MPISTGFERSNIGKKLGKKIQKLQESGIKVTITRHKGWKALRSRAQVEIAARVSNPTDDIERGENE